jgi:S1-C subfamily serine protease
MPDPGPGFSRPCPSCGRRVPRSVAICRCGAEVPAFPDEENPGPEAGGLSAVNLAVGLLLLIAVVITGYWSFTRPPAADVVAPARQGDVVEGGLALPQPSVTSVESRVPDPGTVAGAPQVDQPAATGGDPTTPLEDVVSRIMPAVVLIETSSGRGSGFFVRPDTLITSLHVVNRETFVTLRFIDGTTASARVDLKAPAYDLAVLRLTTPAASQVVIPIGSAGTLRPGQEVITIGSALGTLQNSVSRGVVSGLRRSGDATLIQNDAAANPGNSGGPLLDRNGVAVGVMTGGDQERPGINFAVAIDHARDILEGRLAAPTAKPLALADARAVTPGEERAPDGERVFLETIARLAEGAKTLDSAWQGFRKSCFTGAIAGAFSHEWLVMLTPRAITPAQAGGGTCPNFLVEFQKEATRFGQEMRTALEDARRAGVLPGVVRDALRTNRLEFDGWER